MSLKLSRRNMASGMAVMAIGLLLFSQTLGSDGAITEDGFDPMAYPQILTLLFTLLGACICFMAPTAKEASMQVPIVTKRVCATGGLLLLYGLVFDPLGFILSSFLASCGCALLMGWRRIPFLLGVNAVATLGIWATFTYLLKISLPGGIFF